MEGKNQQDEQVKNLAFGAKQIILLMDESNERVAALRSSVQSYEDTYDALQKRLKSLRDLHNRSTVTFETNEDFQTHIKDMRDALFDSARSIYSLCQDVHKQIRTLQESSSQIDALLNANYKKLSTKQEELALQKNELEAELANITKECVEKQTAIENQKQENNEIASELKSIAKKIEAARNRAAAKDRAFEKTVQELDEENRKLEEQLSDETVVISELQKTLGESKNSCTILELEQQISELKEQILKVEFENDVKICTIKDLSELITDNDGKIESIKQSITDTEEKRNAGSNKFQEITQRIEETEKNTVQKAATSKEIISEYEENLRNQKVLNEDLSQEISCIRNKLEEIVTESSAIEEYIKTALENPVVNFDAETEKINKEYEEVKKDLQETEAQYKNEAAEFEVKIRSEKAEIHILDAKIKDKNQDIEKLESSMTGYKLEVEKINEEMKKTKDLAKGLDDKIYEFKLKIPEKRPRLTYPGRHGKSPSKPETPKKAPRHWDSDSSMEGVDNSAYLKVRESVHKMFDEKES